MRFANRLRMSFRIGLLLVFMAVSANAASLTTLSRVTDRAMFLKALSNRYIVRVTEGLDPLTVAGLHGLKPDYVYRSAINGFATEIPPGTLITQGAKGIFSLEKDQLVELSGGGQFTATWGLDRLDQRALPLNQHYS